LKSVEHRLPFAAIQTMGRTGRDDAGVFSGARGPNIEGAAS
jgi:hypothetical protein